MFSTAIAIDLLGSRARATAATALPLLLIACTYEDLPSLEELLSNEDDLGQRLLIETEPGRGFHYSSGGFGEPTESCLANWCSISRNQARPCASR